ncbi:DUF2848 domain-containing protein [Lacisediminimonas profundi]|uniref:DUF2848 domain-containing protein n=1 Tax=Lacisediminimonas profundi TaxID=2603856 RepID=UPI00124B4D3F|nr:DUF2848 domain-containing protein [Lacisediminimonas profundi]
MHQLKFSIDGQVREVAIKDLVVAGWTGRDADAVEHHIAELEAIGVARPRTVPCFYRVSNTLLTTEENLDMTGPDSSGEAEFVIVSLEDGLYVGIGSDHTDRKVEAYGVTVSKQMCAKPVSATLWRLADVEAHWDSLLLRSWVTRNGERSLYQEGLVTKMLAPLDLIGRYTNGGSTLPVGTAMYCGTLTVIGPIGGGERFEVELEDPVNKRILKHAYNVRTLPYVD